MGLRLQARDAPAKPDQSQAQRHQQTDAHPMDQALAAPDECRHQQGGDHHAGVHHIHAVHANNVTVLLQTGIPERCRERGRQRQCGPTQSGMQHVTARILEPRGQQGAQLRGSQPDPGHQQGADQQQPALHRVLRAQLLGRYLARPPGQQRKAQRTGGQDVGDQIGQGQHDDHDIGHRGGAECRGQRRLARQTQNAAEQQQGHGDHPRLHISRHGVDYPVSKGCAPGLPAADS